VTEKKIKDIVSQKAFELFNSGIAHDPFVQKDGKVRRPIPIYGPDSDISSWFVGVTVKDKIVGFMQLDKDLTLIRYSTFQRHPSTIEGCPNAHTWLDPNYIVERARTKASRADKLATPFLSYDRSPSRLAWVVKATDKKGHMKKIFVAGDFVYLSD
jgi:hypothetical protein